MALLVTGLVLTLWLSTAAAADSYRLQDARSAARALSEQSEQLRREVTAMDAAPALAQRASELGMVPVQDSARLVVAPDGTVTVAGTPKAAIATAPPAPPPASSNGAASTASPTAAPTATPNGTDPNSMTADAAAAAGGPDTAGGPATTAGAPTPAPTQASRARTATSTATPTATATANPRASATTSAAATSTPTTSRTAGVAATTKPAPTARPSGTGGGVSR